jgi:hypothetical protein
MRLATVLGMCTLAYVVPGCNTSSTDGGEGGSSGTGGSAGAGGGAGGSGGTGGACDGACGSPSDFSGTWTGTYQCTFRTSSCGTTFGGDITLEVTQDGCAATYSDGTDTFTGSVCGDTFDFEKTAGDPGSTESGLVTLLTPTTARKESTFVSTDGSNCTGDCADNLSR